MHERAVLAGVVLALIGSTSASAAVDGAPGDAEPSPSFVVLATGQVEGQIDLCG